MSGKEGLNTRERLGAKLNHSSYLNNKQQGGDYSLSVINLEDEEKTLYINNNTLVLN